MCALGIVLGFFVGYSVPTILSIVSKSLYDRSEMDKLMKELLPNGKVKDATTTEVLIVAYEYNSQEPRFYSKYFSK